MLNGLFLPHYVVYTLCQNVYRLAETLQIKKIIHSDIWNIA